jgi:hypothetical protein
MQFAIVPALYRLITMETLYNYFGNGGGSGFTLRDVE